MRIIMLIIVAAIVYALVWAASPLLFAGVHESEARIAQSNARARTAEADAKARIAQAKAQSSIADSTASVAISAVTANTLLTAIIIGGALTLTAIVLVYLLRRDELNRQMLLLEMKRQAVANPPSEAPARHPYWHIEEPYVTTELAPAQAPPLYPRPTR